MSDIIVTDTPHPQIGCDLRQQRADISRASTIDFTGCNVSTIVMAFNDYNHAAFDAGQYSHAMETWPDDVKAKLRDEIEKFSARNGGAIIVAVTQGISPKPRGFNLALHWRPRA